MGFMTPKQLKLLKSLAESKIAELHMGIASIDEMLRGQGQNLTEKDIAFLSMQRGQILSVTQELQDAYDAVTQESPGIVIGR